jgi:hypothetical protein
MKLIASSLTVRNVMLENSHGTRMVSMWARSNMTKKAMPLGKNAKQMASVYLAGITKTFGTNIMEFAYGMLVGMWLTVLIIMTLLRINDQ